MPKGKKHTPEQIVAILRRSDSGFDGQVIYLPLEQGGPSRFPRLRAAMLPLEYAPFGSVLFDT